MPTPCRGCGTILQASYAAQNGFCCPVCNRHVCYACGCTDDRPCSATARSQDGAHETLYVCGWQEPGCCSFCAWRAGYEFYQEATGRPVVDPFYLSIGRSVRTVKGLGRGV